MDKRLKKITNQYFEKGVEMKRIIKNTLVKNNIEVLTESPTSIHFIPWPIRTADLSLKMSGDIYWNPINDLIIIQYHFRPSYDANIKTYSRCLRWYLLRWNEHRSKAMKSNGLRFIYPGEAKEGITLQASRRINIGNIEKKIRMLLLQLNDTMEEESDAITDILSGNLPTEFKQDILDEIIKTLSEMYVMHEE